MAFKRKKAVIFIALVLALAGIANLDVSITQGVNGQYRLIHMPLAVKCLEFLTRHYEYGRIAKEVTRDCLTDQQEVLTMLQWTYENVRKVPPDMPVVDDHTLNIIIRGYGTSEQACDVFTTLAAYRGFGAFYGGFYNKAKAQRYHLSFVRIKGRWYVFDPYMGMHFMTREGGLASVEDVVKDTSILSDRRMDMIVNEAPYREYFRDIVPVRLPSIPRPQRQMPWPRLVYEIKEAVGIEKD